MTTEHLRPLLDSARDSELLWELGQSVARGQVLRLGRITALRKPSGGIRGIVVGDVFRRLAIAQQISPAVEWGTAPFQYALTTRAGAECIAHVIQTLTDVDQEATVLSVDGVGAFDLISGSPCWKGFEASMAGIQFSRSCLSFTALHPRTFGRTIRVWSTKSSKVRLENIPIRSCLPSSQSVSTEHWRPQETVVPP